jgi:hypothetical protein
VYAPVSNVFAPPNQLSIDVPRNIRIADFRLVSMSLQIFHRRTLGIDLFFFHLEPLLNWTATNAGSFDSSDGTFESEVEASIRRMERPNLKSKQKNAGTSCCAGILSCDDSNQPVGSHPGLADHGPGNTFRCSVDFKGRPLPARRCAHHAYNERYNQLPRSSDSDN